MFRNSRAFHEAYLSASSRLSPSSTAAAMRTIVVPLDGSPAAERVLPLCKSLAGQMAVPLRLVHVRQSLHAQGNSDMLLVDDGSRLTFKLRSERYLEGVAASIRSSGVQVTTETVHDGSVADGIERSCGPSNLVVLSSTPKSSWSRFWNGSTLDRLVGRLRVPLLMVPQQWANDQSLAEWRPERVLLPLDDGASPPELVQHTLAAIPNSDSEYTLLSVIPLWTLTQRHQFWGDATAGPGSIAAALRTQAWFRLTRVRRQLQRQHRSVTCRVMFDELPMGQAIVFHASAFRADLIAIAHRPSMWSFWTGESTAAYVARHSSVPVLICPQSS